MKKSKAAAAVKKFQLAYEAAVLSHRFAKYNKAIVMGFAIAISGLSLYLGNDAISTVADTFGLAGMILTPNAQP